MYLHYVLRDLAAGAFTSATEQLPEGLKGYYINHWRRMGMTQRPAPELKLNVLGVLSLLRTPLSVRTIAKIVDAPLTDVCSVVDEWREFLHMTQEEGEHRYRLYHASFQEFLQTQDAVQDTDIARFRKLVIKRIIKRPRQ